MTGSPRVNSELQIIRARVSLKYPYFQNTENLFSTQVKNTSFMYIHTPADTDIIYACYGETFWRFDMAYTAHAPLIPTLETTVPWVGCLRIISFTQCSDEIYVLTYTKVYYSRNGGRTFIEVDNDKFLINGVAQDIVGLAIPNL